ncbi:MAG: YbgA family protein [Actinobacteria bacterium]|nr:YbgA family protein [Actinomycetota bacterium]
MAERLHAARSVHRASVAPPSSSSPNRLLHLQRLVGNRAVQRFLGGALDQLTQRPVSTTRLLSRLDAVERAKVERLRSQIGWIDGLPSRIKDDIDVEFGAGAIAKRIQNEFKASALKELRRSPEWKSAKKAQRPGLLRAARDRHARQARARIAARGITPGKGGFSASETWESLFPIQGKADRWSIEVGRMARRVDFLAQYEHALGSVAAVRRHFTAIVPVAGAGFLHAAAASRLKMARDVYRKRAAARGEPDAPFPTTGTSQALRRRHYHRVSGGKLGHPLGLSLDFRAYENPHLHGKRAFLEAVLGADDLRMTMRDQKGQAMGWSERRRAIRALGKHTQAARGGGISGIMALLAAMLRGEKPATGDTSKHWLVEEAGDAFDRVAGYSERFKNLLTADEKAELLQALQDLKNGAAPKDEVDQRVRDLLAPLIDGINASTEAARAIADESPGHDIARIAPRRRNRAAAAVKRVRVAKADRARRQLATIAGQYPEVFAGLDLDESSSPGEMQAALMARLRSVYYAFEVQKKQVHIAKLERPDYGFIFGKVKLRRRGGERTWQPQLQAGDPSVWQLLDKGFVRRDAEPGTGADRSELGLGMNRLFYEVMVEHGFDPGGAWDSMDTMHFDFVEGFDAVVGKGTVGPVHGWVAKKS